MCLTIPTKVVKVNKNRAQIQSGCQVDITLLPSVRVGDYILEQAGLAIRKLPKKEAREILKILNNG